MKIRTSDRDVGAGRGRWGVQLAGFAVALMAALPAFGAAGGSGQGGGGNGAGPNNQGGLSAGGDETVGTLPSFGAGRIDLPIVRSWRGVEPALYLEGVALDVGSLVHGARGRGYVSCEVLDATTGRVRVAFHGDVLVALHRELAESLDVEIGLAVPATFEQGRAAVRFGDAATRVVRLQPGVLPLPVATMIGTGALDVSAIQIRTANAAGIHSAHSVATTDDLVLLRQTD